MQTAEDIRRIVELGNVDTTSRMLKDLIDHDERGRVARKLIDRYEQKNLPIQTRQTRNPNKIDERVPNDFYADIVDTKTGYMGNEVTVDSPEDEAAADAIAQFQMVTDAVDQNSEMVKHAAMTGAGYRLLYIPEGRNEVRMRLLPSDETMVFKDQSLGETEYAMRYWTVRDVRFGANSSAEYKRTVVEWYDRENITYFIDDGRKNFSIDTNKGSDGVQPHLFDGVPIIEFLNNAESQAEPEKAVPLIDAYDTILSATVSEIEQLRLAYMLLKGIGLEVDDKLLALMEQTGILPVDNDGDARFITKELAVDAVKVILDEIRTNIYEFSRSIDLSKDFGGDLRIIGWQVALLNLENSCKVTERKFKAALREQWRLITEKWRQWGTANVDHLDLRFTFTRNFPKDIMSEIEMLGKAKGVISTKTAYGLVSFIDDPQAEIEALEEEADEFEKAFGELNANQGSVDEPEPNTEDEPGD